jgi:hypothetical protein
MKITGNALAVGVVAAVMLVLAPNAFASGAITISNAHSENRHVVASISLSAYGEVWGAQVATKPDRGTDGDFFTENRVIYDFWGGSQSATHSTQYVSTDPLDPGTYYLMIFGYDTTCFAVDISLDCGPIFSNVLPVTVEEPPNQQPTLRITSVTFPAYATVRVCDDTKGTMTLRETLKRTTFGNRRVRVRRRVVQRDGPTFTANTPDCDNYLLPFPTGLRGVGRYVFTIIVTDAKGSTSKPAVKKFTLIGD